MSWKKEAAIGGAVTIRTVKINPSPPCCNAMLLMHSVVAPVKLPTQKAAATARTIFNAMATITLNSASGHPHADHCCRTIKSQPVRCPNIEKAPPLYYYFLTPNKTYKHKPTHHTQPR